MLEAPPLTVGSVDESECGGIDMTYYFCQETLGFFTDAEHGDAMPPDVVKVTEDQYFALFEGQSQGKQITTDKRGRPQLVDPPPPPVELLENLERSWRDLQLAQTDAVVLRHRDELETGKTTLTADQYTQLQAYRQALREWPQGGNFPASKLRPGAPDWLVTPES